MRRRGRGVGAERGLERGWQQRAPTVAVPTPMEAALEAAITGLSDQIDRMPLGAKMSVGSYLDDVKGHPFLRATLQRAQVVGGARPMGGGLVQVRLDISGRTVSDALVQVATTNARRSKVTPEFVARESRGWSDRTFTAVGVGGGQAGGPVVADARASGAQVGAEQAAASPEAIDAAKRSAAQGLLDQIATVPVSPNRSVRYLLELPEVADSVTAYLISRPVKNVDAKASGEVRVFLILDKAEFFGVLETASVKARAALDGAPITDAAWGAMKAPILANVPEVIEGVALPKRIQAAMPGGERVAIMTDRPPDWFFLSLEVTATSPDAGSKLLTGSQAEAAAQAELGRRLDSLVIGEHLTLGAAAKRDRHYADPLAQALARARVIRVEYLEDGSARVRMTTDARYLWQDIVVAAQAKP